MLQFFADWYRRYLSDPQAVLLLVLLVLLFGVVIVLGRSLAPVLAAVVIAYMLEGLVQKLERRGIRRSLAVLAVFLLFIAFLVFLVMGLLPVLSRQLQEFVRQLPTMITNTQAFLLRLPEHYPQLFTHEQIVEMITSVRTAIGGLGQSVLTLSLASVPAIITVLVYVVLVPLLVFFFLKDKEALVAWVTQFLPQDHSLLTRVWHEMDDQIGNYVRGKVYEILIVGGVSYVVFALFGLAYAPLLAVLVGVSVIIPYIGATVVTLPVALVAYFQWGWSAEFGWLMLAYFVIQILDGNLLVPLLFSETVNLHPVAIIVAILAFGGIWGFWGVFFAIPLATLVKALLNAWPRGIHRPAGEQAAPS